MTAAHERGTTAPDGPPNVETASVTLVQGMHFNGAIDHFHISLDAAPSVGGTGAGAQPLQLLLLGVAGCTGMDVISILRKKRQHVSSFVVEVAALRAIEHPRVYTAIEIVYRLRGTAIDPQAVARAIELSETRYCPAISMLSATAPITSRFEIINEGS